MLQLVINGWISSFLEEVFFAREVVPGVALEFIENFADSLFSISATDRIEQVSGNEVLLNQGTIYASLVRLEQRGWIGSRWGTSDNNRKAKFYSITAAGKRQLTADAHYWERLKDVMERVMTMDDSAKGGADA